MQAQNTFGSGFTALAQQQPEHQPHVHLQQKMEKFYSSSREPTQTQQGPFLNPMSLSLQSVSAHCAATTKQLFSSFKPGQQQTPQSQQMANTTFTQYQHTNTQKQQPPDPL